MKSRKDVLNILLKEANSYTSFEEIEKLVQDGTDLSSHPIYPLYITLRSLPIDRAAQALSKFSKEQRRIFLDIDLWDKDNLDVERFLFWPKVYHALADDEIKYEFIKSSEFALFLKARLNIHTFDAEDPWYPESDNYFLTDDNQLLIEFDENFSLVYELKELIRSLYFEMGVEKAYAYLFKLTVDSFLAMQENEYQQKRDRLRDIGFVGYYDALEMDAPFPSVELMDSFIRKKENATGEVADQGKQQVLHSSMVVAFNQGMGDFHDELDKIESEKRREFLHFNFIRLVNASISLTGAMKEGAVAMTRTGAKTRSLMFLGFNYVRYYLYHVMKSEFHEENLFDRFEFTDFYKIGNTLIKGIQKRLKKSIKKSFSDGECHEFSGRHVIDFLDSSFANPVKLSKSNTEASLEVVDIPAYDIWAKRAQTTIHLIPYIRKFYDAIKELVEEGKLLDGFYMNYAVSEIDFEAILISSFANFILGNLQDTENKKMGLTLDEFKSFVSIIINESGKLKNDDQLGKKIREFASSFGLDLVYNFPVYLTEIIREHLEGYEYAKLSKEDFKHVGGPVIFAL